MKFLDGIDELDGKKCHVTCNENYEIQWRKSKNLDEH